MAAPLILHVFPGFGVGGAQSRFVALANRFGGAYRHAVVSLDGSMGCRERLLPGLDVSFPAVELRRGAVLGNLPRLRRLLRALRPDLLVTSNWGSIEWAMANLPRLVPHLHMEDGFGPEERERQLARRVLTRRLVLRGSTVLLPSRTLLRIASERWRLPASRLRFVPNGVDLARFAPGAAAPRRWAGEGPVIGTVAALRPEKRLDRLVEAFARLPGTQVGAARLVIVGEGPERPALLARAAALGVGGRVLLPGGTTETPACYAGFDVFALSSDTEQMPLSVLEAMAAGLPVAATTVGDVPLMLPDEQGALLCPRDAGALSERLGVLLADAALRARLGAANLLAARTHHDAEAMFRAHDALWGGAAGLGGAGSGQVQQAQGQPGQAPQPGGEPCDHQDAGGQRQRPLVGGGLAERQSGGQGMGELGLGHDALLSRALGVATAARPVPGGSA